MRKKGSEKVIEKVDFTVSGNHKKKFDKMSQNLETSLNSLKRKDFFPMKFQTLSLESQTRQTF